jgi:hypothetical protein
MVRINLVEGIRPPLPPATGFEIFQIAIGSLAFAFALGGIAFLIVSILLKLS